MVLQLFQDIAKNNSIMSSNESIVWLNGRLLPAAEAHVSPYDHGFMVGDGAFETLRVYDGRPFAITRHWNRLKNSCKVLGIQEPTLDEFAGAMISTAAANNLKDARVRFSISSGDGPLGSDKGGERPTMAAMAASLPARGPQAKVAVSPWTRNESSALAGVKSSSYGENVVALAHAKKQNADEAIFANTRGEWCEGSGSNVFMVVDGECHTPPLSSGCLAGVTRALVLDIGRSHGIPIKESALPISLLPESQEAFLTSSLREVQSISHVNGRALSQPTGPLSLRLAGLFKQLVKDDLNP